MVSMTSTPRFGRIVHIPDFEAAVQPENPATLARLGELRQQLFTRYGTVIPSIIINANGGQDILLLTDNDAKAFLQETYNFAIPEPLQNQSIEAFSNRVEQGKNAPWFPQVSAFLEQMAREDGRQPFSSLFERVRTYFQGKQADVAGNPIEVITG